MLTMRTKKELINLIQLGQSTCTMYPPLAPNPALTRSGAMSREFEEKEKRKNRTTPKEEKKHGD